MFASFVVHYSRIGSGDHGAWNWGYTIEILFNLENIIPSCRCGVIRPLQLSHQKNKKICVEKVVGEQDLAPR